MKVMIYIHTHTEVHAHKFPHSPSAGGIPLATGVGSGVTEKVRNKRYFLTGLGIGV